ncbi:MAG: 2-amino-4-hydroxy-6-hydroxymethyldihydropteridine diphosphokinase [Planctomycetia bacterium]|nr:2-amino-4-hydroxy-6-hydroxymethyldihydropteridine diphosphokinase [Planctomycetia bacterium]
MKHDVLIGFGANLGDVQKTLVQAEAYLCELPFTDAFCRGECLFTVPVGGNSQDANFLNTVFRLKIAENVTPHDLLIHLKKIEKILGRESHSRWEARKIDLDLLLFDELILDDWPQLMIPHPLIPWRRFVLDAAIHVAGDMIHAPTGLTLINLAEHLYGAENFSFTLFSPEGIPSQTHSLLVKPDETPENLQKCLSSARRMHIPVLQLRQLMRNSGEIEDGTAKKLLEFITEDVRRGANPHNRIISDAL